jgi:RNA polymerase sigma factor (sigma-70 family)
MGETHSSGSELKPLTRVPGRTAAWNHSWSRLYERFGGVILAYARKRGLDDDSAKDVLQEVMVALMRGQQEQAAGYDPKKGTYQQWLWGVIRNRVRSEFRKRVKLEPVDPQSGCEGDDGGGVGNLPAVSEPAPVCEEMDDEGWEQAILEAALKRVHGSAPAEKFAIFTALLQEDSSPEELAKHYGITRNNVDAIKHRYKNKVIEEAQAIRAEWVQLRKI